MRKKLTPKQQTFVNVYIATGNACEAYRQAYDASNMQPRTIEKRASELLNNGEVTGRIAQLSEKAEGEALLSLEEHMRKLRELRDKAESLNQMSAAIKAENLRGELRRFYVKQVESRDVDEFACMSEEELKEYIAKQDEALKAFETKQTKH